MIDTAMEDASQQQSGSGLGANGDRSPTENRPGNSQRGHTAEGFRPTDTLSLFKDAGVKKYHTVCIACGQIANHSHRSRWRNCRGGCPLDATHNHPGKPCPLLMRVANEDWCFKHAGETLHDERDAARDPDHKERAEQRREQKANAPKPSSPWPTQQYGGSQGQWQAPPPGPPHGNWQAPMGPPRYTSNQRPAQGRPSGNWQQPGSYAGYPDSSYGAEYETYGPQGGFADPRHAYDGRYPVPTGPVRGRDPRERSPPRESFPSNGNYRDRAPSMARPTREAPSVESVNDRLAKILAQRKAESGPPSAPKTQPPTPPTPAQDAQGQVQPDLERRVQELEQRHQADMTTVQQQATAIATLQQQHAQLRREHDTLVAELKQVLGGKPKMATATVPETAIEPMAGQTMTDSELFLAEQRGRYPGMFRSGFAPTVQQTLPLHQAQQSLPEQQTTANVESQMPPPQFHTAQQPLTQAHIEEAAEVPLPEDPSQPAPSPALPGFSGGFEGMFDSTGINVFTYKPPDGDSRPNNGYIPPPPRND